MNVVSSNNDSKVLTIVITKGPYISESAEMGLKTALKAKRKGYEVNVFLFLDGTWISHLTSDKKFNNSGDWLKRVIRKGITVKMCERCSKARDLTQCTIIDGIDIPGTYQFIDLLKKSDKVLTFGG
jgi:tRNA 2-thiouridine synthesizing protein D